MRDLQRWALLLAVLALAACDDPTRGDRATGAPCAWGLQCHGEVCLGATLGGELTGWTGGMCTERCSDGLCPADQVCADLGDGLYCLPGCGAAADCRTGYICDDAIHGCVPHCDQAGCPAGLDCGGDGQCAVSTRTPLGGPCIADLDCATGICFAPLDGDTFTGWHGGTCAVACSGGLCPEGGACVVLDGAAWCVAACDAEAACREGYVCQPELGACLPDCTLGWDCGEGYLCDADGTCRHDWPELTPVGGPCQQDAECLDAWCLEAQDSEGPTGWVGGSCTVPCGPAGLCPPESGCMVIEGAGWCLSRCQGPGAPACREGYICDPFMHVCVPSCGNDGWECGEIYECREDGVCGPLPPPGR